MITTDELNELKAMHKRMGEILSRVEAVNRTCQTCGHNRCGFCSVFAADLPPDFSGPCDKWEWSDIPF